jgi:predicted metalloendopeptidase
MHDANACYILPSLMMEPAYGPDKSEVEIYATLGSIFAHEITHGFDKRGATYNKHGKRENWWAAEDLAKFEALNDRRVALNSVFEVLPGHPTDGEKTITEDVADLGGVAVAYDLWVTTLQQRGIKGEELRQQKRAFFRNYAKIYREKYPDEYLIERMSKDTHSAGPIRVNGVVQHMDDWYDLFNVQEGDSLYLAPEERIRIW